MINDILIIFLKPFVIGKVKTRLAKDIGEHQALEIYKALVCHTVAEAEKLSGGVEVYLCYSENPHWSTKFQGGDKFIVQSGETLGERMHNAIKWADEQGFQKKVIIGSDCATLSVAHLTKAYQLLDENDVVIGPANDGGYYLIGAKTSHPELFQNINWSTDTVYTSTLEKIDGCALSVGKLGMLSDIDTLQDLRAAPPFIKADFNY